MNSVSYTSRRLLAEGEHNGPILMALPHSNTDWNYMLPEAMEQYRQLIEKFTGAGEKVLLLCRDDESAKKLLSKKAVESTIFVEANYNDTWTRDYGPITIENHNGQLRALDFGFNGWGLKFASNLDNLVNLQLVASRIINQNAYRNHRDYELEGGSIDTDGAGTIITTTRCLCSPNRNGGKTKASINEILQRRLGTTHVLWLDYGGLDGDDTDSHVDTLARFASPDTIVYTAPTSSADDSQNRQLQAMREQLKRFRNQQGNPYHLVELPTPDPIFDSEGQRLPATYANFLITKRNVFMPTYGQQANDTLAALTLQALFTDKILHTVDCNVLICQHGSLHCATMQVPDQIIAL